MSEKQLREAMRYVRRPDLESYSALGIIERAMADEPDAVKILRFTTGFLEAAWGAVGNEIVGQEKCAFSVYDAILHIVEYIEGEIGVRLTDDG